MAARFALQGPPPEGGPPRPRPPLLRALPAPEVRRETRTENPGASGEPWPGDGGGRDDGAAARGPADGGDAYDAGDLDDLFAAVEEELQEGGGGGGADVGDAHTPDARSDADANPERDWY